MSSKSGAAGEIFIFECEKSHGIWPLKMDTHGECSWCFHSCTWWIKTLPQSLICIEEILLYTVHIDYNINYHWVLILELEAPKCSVVERYMCWNVSWPASEDSLVKNCLSLSSKLYPSHCGMSLHQAPVFILLPNVWLVFKIYFAILHNIVQ